MTFLVDRYNTYIIISIKTRNLYTYFIRLFNTATYLLAAVSVVEML